MIDTNVYDKIVACDGLVLRLTDLIRDEKIVLLTTHVQNDELAKIADIEKLREVLKVPTKTITTSGSVWDVSKWNNSSWGGWCWRYKNL